jgi:hypothetical protein
MNWQGSVRTKHLEICMEDFNSEFNSVYQTISNIVKDGMYMGVTGIRPFMLETTIANLKKKNASPGNFRILAEFIQEVNH